MLKKGIVFVLLLLWFGVFFSHRVLAESQIASLLEVGISYPITQTILHIQPRVSWEYANFIANIILRKSEKYDVDWRQVLAIAFRESSIIHQRHGRVCGIDFHGNPACVYTEKSFGHMGVHYKSWYDKIDIDLERLLVSIEYGYELGARILAITKKRTKQQSRCWIGEYHSRTPHLKQRYCAKIYETLNQIDAFLFQLKKNLQQQPTIID